MNDKIKNGGNLSSDYLNQQNDFLEYDSPFEASIEAEEIVEISKKLERKIKVTIENRELEIDISNLKGNKKITIIRDYSNRTNEYIMGILDNYGEEEGVYHLYIDGRGNLSISLNDPRVNFYNKRIALHHHLLSVRQKDSCFLLRGILLLRDWSRKVKPQKLSLQIDERIYPIMIKGMDRVIRFRGAYNYFVVYTGEIPYQDLLELEIHTPVFMVYEDENGYTLKRKIKYNIFDRSKGKYKASKIKPFEDTSTALFFRQSAGNTIYVTNRGLTPLDKPKERIKLALAYYAAKLVPSKGVLLYEKESSKFEENASVLFQELVKEEYKDVNFVLDKASPAIEKVPDFCKPYLLDKYSFKHYFHFFNVKAFLGTETVSHALELRCNSKYALKRINQKDINFVFLQHGVTYMISWASKFKKDNRKGQSYPKNTKIVVSSNEEAKHFIEEGLYSRKDLYITGFPKFDRAIRYKEADKIVLMPTWRPWDYNMARISPENTSYYRFVMNIFSQIPEEFKEYLVILPHPLIKTAFNNTDLEKYMPENVDYDEVLRKTSLLITDYSSIAYDAFYRGANIIFCWEEKDLCMEYYGGYLKLNEDNVFADVSIQYSDLPELIKSNHNQPQRSDYINKYRKIVAYNDGKNTVRLIKALEADGVIQKDKR